MTKKQAETEFLQMILDKENCLTLDEVIARVGLTTLRVMWCDYCDSLNKDFEITDKQAYEWGQPSYLKNRRKK